MEIPDKLDSRGLVVVEVMVGRLKHRDVVFVIEGRPSLLIDMPQAIHANMLDEYLQRPHLAENQGRTCEGQVGDTRSTGRGGSEIAHPSKRRIKAERLEHSGMCTLQ